MKRLGFRVSPDQQRRLFVVAGGCLLGLAIALWLWPLDSDALAALRQEVARLQTQTELLLQAQRQAQQTRLAGDRAGQSGAPVPDEPGLTEAGAVWSWLQQRLQAHGFQVQALRPQAVTVDKDMREQAVALRLQGRWRDWLAFEESLDAHAPWWTIDHWQVVPVGPPSEDVHIDVQVRLGLRPLGLEPEGTPRVWPVWPVDSGEAQASQADPFAQAQKPAFSTMADEGAASLPADPRQWPIAELRLLGIWRQAGAVHAVLGAGLNKVVVQWGQRVGREAYRVRRIGEDHVELAAAGTSGPVLRLTMQGGKP